MSEVSPNTDPNMRETSRGTLLLGDLSNDFLRMPTAAETEDQVSRDELMAKQLAAQEVQQTRMQQGPVVISDRLFISPMEAKMNKNYGLVRMDPYCRVRVNHNVYETDTSYNGAKNPNWSKTISVPFTDDVKTVYIEVFDEKALATDNRIAWLTISLPDSVKNGEPLDKWWPLDGKLGDEKEGSIHVMLTIKKVQQRVHQPPVMYQQPLMYPPGQGQAVVVPGNPYYTQVPGMPTYYPSPQQGGSQQPNPQQPRGPLFTEEDVKQIKEMFPEMDEEAIKTVLEASRGHKDAAINSLLAMQ